VDVWVTYQLAGATVAAAQHECGRRTVYRWIDRVEADPALVADGRARLEAPGPQAAASADTTRRIVGPRGWVVLAARGRGQREPALR
jgi:hypothetical protein